MDKQSVSVALVGNPNVGKSTVFNHLTGLNRHTGNWPGKTVDHFGSTVIYEGKEYRFVDLPGTYSLRAVSKEEQVTCDFIANEKPDVTVCVINAANLERNLSFLFQVRLLSPNCVACLNLLDEAKAKGITIDVQKLERELSMPVVPTIARNGTGIGILMKTIADVASKAVEWSQPQSDVSMNALGRTESQISQDFSEASAISAKVTHKSGRRSRDLTHRIDSIVTSRAVGVPLMLLLLGVVFFITLYLSNYPSDLLFNLLSIVESRLSGALGFFKITGWVHDILILGIFRTVAYVAAVMFPPMAIFFPMFSLLEDSGYLPRIAFNLDHLFQKCGGHGKQSLTMAMGFGCNAAGVVATRIIESPRERLIAILTNVFVPCNGRFPTLMLLSSVFFHGITESLGTASFMGQTAASNLLVAAGSGIVILAAIVIGVLSTFLVSFMLSRTALKGFSSSFIMELPPYRKPKVAQVIIRSFKDRTVHVLKRALIVAAPCGAITWLLANIPVGGGSLLVRMAGFFTPLANVLGMDGTILLAYVLGFPANEIVIPVALMSYLSQKAMSQAGSIASVKAVLVSQGWTWVTAVSAMLFSLLHFPCGTTVYTVYKETRSKKWTLLSVLIPTVFACLVLILFQLILRAAAFFR